jgi:riboflavin biosynthesis pyrimidine reductase
LPWQLAELYDGGLAIRDGSVYANFVSSIDGVAALEGGQAPSGGIISGKNEADRFVMGLLRAFAEAIVVGAGTVRAEGGRALWTPDFIYPAAADAYRELRRSLHREPVPRLVIVTGRGDLNPSERALQAGALVLTTETAATHLRKTLPSASEVRAISDGASITIDAIFRALQSAGYRTILTEGGPHLFGEMVADRRVDELFLTVSPDLLGRRGDDVFGVIQGVDFGRSPRWTQLLSARRHESHLFLRYALKPDSSLPPAGEGQGGGL